MIFCTRIPDRRLLAECLSLTCKAIAFSFATALISSQAYALSSDANLYFSENFDSNSKPKGTQLECISDSISTSNFGGRKALRLTVDPRWPYGDKYNGIEHKCPVPYAMRLPRAEWNIGSGIERKLTGGGHYWIGFDHFVPNDWEDRKLVLFQTHAGTKEQMDACDKVNAPSPHMALRAESNGELRFTVRYVEERCYTSQKDQLKMSSEPMGQLPKGDWVNFVIYFYLSHTNEGRAVIWKDGQQVVDYRGPTFYNDTNRSIYYQMGQYYSSGMNGNGKPSTLYIDNVKMATGVDAYSLVSSIPTERPRPVPLIVNIR